MSPGVATPWPAAPPMPMANVGLMSAPAERLEYWGTCFFPPCRKPGCVDAGDPRIFGMGNRIHLGNHGSTGGKSIRTGRRELAEDGKGLTKPRSKAKDCEVVIEGRSLLDAESAHHRKAGAVDEREVLILPVEPDLPGG